MKVEVYAYELWIEKKVNSEVTRQSFHLRWLNEMTEWEDKWVTMEGAYVGVLYEKRIPWWRFW